MSTVTVSSTTGLMQALSAAHAGDTILLAAGYYSGVVIQNLNAGGVTISSADTTHPAQITDFQINSSSGLSFSNIVLNSDPSIPGVSAAALADPYPFRIQSSTDIHFSSMSIHGSLDNNDTTDRAGLFMSLSSNISVANSEFQQLSFGIVHSDSSYLTFTGNNFHDLRFAGIHGSSSFVTITGNYFHDFHPVAGDHPDAIHFFNETTTDAPHDVLVSQNVIMLGNGDPIQGIYFELPTASNSPLSNITINDNLLVGTMYNGIALEDANALPNTNIKITSNTIATIGSMTARIWLGNTTGAIETDNQAGAFIFGYGSNVTFDPSNTNAGLTYTNDTTIAPVTDGGQALLQQFLAAHPGFTLPGSSTVSSSPAPTLAPSAPTGLSLALSTDSGVVGDHITNIAQVRIDGSAQPGCAVTLYDGSTAIGSGVADAAGAFQILCSSALSNGQHALTAVAANSAGSATSAALSVTIDNQPAAAAILSSSASGGSTGSTVALSGNSSDQIAGVGYSVAIFEDGVQVGSVSPTSGAWSFSQANVTDAVHNYTIRTSDAAGNVGAGSNDVIFGSSGRDTIVAGSGTNLIDGGGGADTLTGGSGMDTFIYQATSDAPYPNRAQKAVEIITNFTSGADHIDLTGLGHLTYGGQTQTVVPHSVEWYVSGGNTYIVGDALGHTKPDFMIELIGVHALTSSDFLLG